MDMPKSKETAHQRLSRMFGMGKFGEEMAQEILDQYVVEYTEKLNAADDHFWGSEKA